MPAELDALRMAQALDLAELAIGLSDPNPRVGCVIGHEDGRVLGKGHTQEAGAHHAEAAALAEIQRDGLDARGATAWVSLEPCSHHGRTPPCCDALIRAGIRRVVVGAVDPYPRVSGRGIDALRAAGVDVVMAPAAIAMRSRVLNVGFNSRHERARPWVRLKVATSLDGRIALQNGQSQWITGLRAREDGHSLRKRASVVVTGIGTVLADDPRMDVRLVATAIQPLRLVMDSRLRIPLGARLLQPPGRAAVAVDATLPDDHPKLAALAERGVDIWRIEGDGSEARLLHLMDKLAQAECNELHVEAGSRLNGAFIRAGLVDELIVYIAPLLLGPGRDPATLNRLEAIGAGHRFTQLQACQVGDDIRLRCMSAAAANWLAQPALSEGLTVDPETSSYIVPSH